MSEQTQVSGAQMIVVNDLTKSYDGKINAITEISLDIDKGEFTVLFGPSGVGKSTLLRCLNYLVEPTSGDVIVDGQVVGDMSNKELLAFRSHVGMIFQEFNLINRMSVLVNVMCGRLHDLGFCRALTYSFSQEDHEAAIHALRGALSFSAGQPNLATPIRARMAIIHTVYGDLLEAAGDGDAAQEQYDFALSVAPSRMGLDDLRAGLPALMAALDRPARPPDP